MNSTLYNTLANLRGSKPVTIVALTPVKAGSLGRIFKRSRVNGFIGFNYTSAVNNRREREGTDRTFTALPRKWGERINSSPLVTHKGKFYLEMYVQRSLAHQYLDREGNPLNPNQILKYIPIPSDNSWHQGVDREVVVRDYNLENIESLKIDGKIIVVSR